MPYLWVFVPLHKFWSGILNSVITATFHILPNSLSCSHSTLTGCPRRKGQYSGRSQYRHSIQESVYVHVFYSERFTRWSYVLTRVAKCIDVDGGIFGNLLYWANCTNFATGSVNTPKTIRDNRRRYFLWDPPRGYIMRSSEEAVFVRS
jgi:hypothetical protein